MAKEAKGNIGGRDEFPWYIETPVSKEEIKSNLPEPPKTEDAKDNGSDKPKQ